MNRREFVGSSAMGEPERMPWYVDLFWRMRYLPGRARRSLLGLICLAVGHSWSEWRSVGPERLRSCARCGRMEASDE